MASRAATTVLVAVVVVSVLAACGTGAPLSPAPPDDRGAPAPGTTTPTEGPPIETLAYGSGPDQVLDLHLPDGTRPVPVVVLLHGGFWRDVYVRDLTEPLARDLVRRGYAAVNLEYGRVGGTGGWPRTFEDVAAGIDHLASLEHPRLDLDRVAVVGHSAGGLLATWTATRPSLTDDAVGGGPAIVPCAVVSLAGVNELIRAAEEGLGAGAVEDLLGGGPEDVPERYAVADPARQLPLAAPWLGVHAEADGSVPVDMTTGFAEAARAAGSDVTVELVAGDHMSVIDPSRPSWDVVLTYLADRCR